MPIWDHLFGTYREYKKSSNTLAPKTQQDFVFIGHNGGLGHLLTIPGFLNFIPFFLSNYELIKIFTFSFSEISIYNVYDTYMRSYLPIELEFLLVNIVNQLFRLVSSSYLVPRYLIDGRYVGRIICVLRTPIDYISGNLKIYQLFFIKFFFFIEFE